MWCVPQGLMCEKPGPQSCIERGGGISTRWVSERGSQDLGDLTWEEVKEALGPQVSEE